MMLAPASVGFEAKARLASGAHSGPGLASGAHSGMREAHTPDPA